jgi:hypothetical protein
MGFVIDITERTFADEAMKKSREELEQWVREKTKEIEIKAQKLEELNTA